MATLAKAYYVTHIDGLKIDASSWRRPFDDLYDELNGRLDSNNLAASLTFNSDKVIFSSTLGYYSATSLSGHFREVVPQGYNDVHFLACGPKLSIFPGRFENDGIISRIKSRIDLNVTAMNLLDTTDGLTGVMNIAVIFNAVANITASDIFICPDTGGTRIPALATANAKLGVYVTGSFPATTLRRRALYSFVYDMTASGGTDNEFYTPPVNAQAYTLRDSEAIVHPLFKQAYVTGTGLNSGGVTAIHRFFNRSTYRYDWEFEGRFLTSTNVLNLTAWSGVGLGEDGEFSLDGIVFRGAGGTWCFNGHFLNSASTLQAEIRDAFSGITIISELASNGGSAGLFHIKLKHAKCVEGRLTNG